jgi:hypothetical protein
VAIEMEHGKKAGAKSEAIASPDAVILKKLLYMVLTSLVFSVLILTTGMGTIPCSFLALTGQLLAAGRGLFFSWFGAFHAPIQFCRSINHLSMGIL